MAANHPRKSSWKWQDIQHMLEGKYVLIMILASFLIAATIHIMIVYRHPGWDESIYLGMGKYIYSGGQSGLWEMIRPLGLPLVTGAFWKLGLDQIIASRIFSILVSAGIIITVFLLAKELFDRRHALLSAAIMASTPIFFYYSDYILTDHISTLFLMLSILFMVKGRYVLGGLFGGLAFWFKFTHTLYFAAIMLYMTYRTWTMKKARDRKIHPGFIAFSIIMLGLIGAYFFSNYILYHDHFNSAMDAMTQPYTDALAYSDNPYQNTTFEDFKGFMYYASYYIFSIIFDPLFGSLIYLSAMIYLLHMKRFLRDSRHVLIGIVFLIYLLYFSVIPYKQDRFWITFLPFLAIYASYGILQIMERIRSPGLKVKSWTRSVLGISVLLVVSSSFMISGLKIANFYEWKDTIEVYDDNIERYFDNLGIDEPILTTDPRLIAYSDKRYVGAYNIVVKDGLFMNSWESDIDFAAVIYRSDSLPCMEEDLRCVDNKAKIYSFIQQRFIPLDTYTYQGSDVTFYIEKNGENQ